MDQQTPFLLLNLELADPATAIESISAALRWRDASDARQLMLNILVRDSTSLAELATVVRHVDATAARHRDRCGLRIYCMFTESIEGAIHQLAEADTRVPRIEVIRIVDQPLEVPCLTQLSREARSAEAARLTFWAYLELSSTRELAQLAGLINNGAGSPLDQVEFRRFPVVEVPGQFSLDDAESIARFWSQHPQVQDAATRSLHGRVRAFFRLFEIARLAHLGVVLPPLSGDTGADDYRDLPAFSEWLRRSGLMTAEPRLESVILEHDVDLLADSHECQSPVFSFAGITPHAEATRS
jgi:hypothetical protein